MTTAPGLTMSPVTKPSRPTAATRISAAAQTSFRFFVLEWQIVTVAFFASSSSAAGLPTMFERPMTTAFLPAMSMPVDSIMRMQPAGVQGR